MEIERLRTERKTRSAALQQWLFKQFRMLNALGEEQEKNLCDLFKDTVQKTPPAGAGECAAPQVAAICLSEWLATSCYG